MLEKTKKTNLGIYVFFALLAGLTVGQLLRISITNVTTLTEISEYFNMIAGLFLRLIKMIIAPLIFSTLVVGIAKLNDAKTLGRMFLKAMFIFLLGGIISLAIGFIIVDTFQPGKILGEVFRNSSLSFIKNQPTTEIAHNLSLKMFLEQIIPISIFESFSNNQIIQIVVFSIFFGIAGVSIGKKVVPVFEFLELISKLMFKVTEYVMKLAPIAVFCAVGGIIIGNGLGILSSYVIYLLEFMLGIIVLWGTMILIGFMVMGKKIFTLLQILADSLAISFSTASSEAVLPNVLEELEKFGVRPKISGFILPLGYSFNLIGSMLNCSFATMFILQLHGYNLSATQQITMLLMLMITSKGIAGIPRASLVIVAATLASMGIPESAILILFPVDGFLDMARSATNVFANALSAVFVDKWEKNKHI